MFRDELQRAMYMLQYDGPQSSYDDTAAILTVCEWTLLGPKGPYARIQGNSSRMYAGISVGSCFLNSMGGMLHLLLQVSRLSRHLWRFANFVDLAPVAPSVHYDAAFCLRFKSRRSTAYSATCPYQDNFSLSSST